MADNVAISATVDNEVAQATIAADEISSALYQRVKVSHGADGSATDSSPSNPFPVFVSHDALGDGRKTVSSAGTAEALVASSTPCKRVHVQGLEANTGTVVVGGSTVVATSGTRRGIALVAGQAVTIQIDDLAKVYVDAVVTGEGVSFVYET